MYITAAIIGIGIYILFTDLPKGGQEIAYKYKWAAHACVFFGLFAMHGGSAEGTVLAAIGTVVFRWLMHMAEKRHTSKAKPAKQPLLTPEEYISKLDAGITDTQTIILAAVLLAIMLYNH